MPSSRPAPAYPVHVLPLLRRHARGGVAITTVLAAARQILQDDARFAAGGRGGRLAPLWRWPTRPEYLRALATMAPRARAKLIKHLTDDLVGLVHRPTVELQPLGAGAVTFRQRATRLEQVRVAGRWVWRQHMGLTLSSQAAARDRASGNRHLREHLANAHEITAGPSLVAFRSARSDTPAKMRQKLTAAALAALEAAAGDPTRATGWHEREGAWHFAPTLITAMDRSLLKHVYLTVMRLFGGEPSERTRLAELQASVGEVFAGGAELGVWVQARGQLPRRVLLGPPKVLNIVLSGQSSVAANIRAARRGNQAMMLALWGETVGRWERSADAGRRALAASLGRPDSVAAARRALAALSSPARPGGADDLAQLDTRARLALEALALTLAGRGLAGQTLVGRSDPGDEVLLVQALLEEADNAALIECKSGLDRTLTLAALMAAARARADAGEPFDPLDPRADRTAMRQLFTRFADALGSGPVKLTRSRSGHVKWSSQPTPRAWYAGDGQLDGPLGKFIR